MGIYVQSLERFGFQELILSWINTGTINSLGLSPNFM
jgi:hypothetical protein